MYLKQCYNSDTKMLCLLFYMLKIGGVLTISLKTKPSKDAFLNLTSTFSHSKSGILYNVFLIIVVLVGSYFAIFYSYFVKRDDLLEFERVADVIQTLLTIVTVLFILTIFATRQDTALKLAILLVEAYRTSKLLKCRTAEKRNVWGMRLMFVTYVVTATVYLSATPTYNIHTAIYFASVGFFNLVISNFFIQYSLSLMLVRHCFAIINEALLDLRSQQPISESIQLSLRIIEKYNVEAKMQRLGQLHEAYASLTKLTRSLANFYSLPMLVCSANAFVTLIDYLYYAVKPVVLGSSFYLPPMLIVRCILQVIFTIISLAMLTTSVGRVISESNLTGEIVNECLSSLKNDQLANKLNQFSNYLLHKDIKFTAVGLFTIDGTMLIGILSSITTYLVILLQFKESGSKGELNEKKSISL